MSEHFPAYKFPIDTGLLAGVIVITKQLRVDQGGRVSVKNFIKFVVALIPIISFSTLPSKADGWYASGNIGGSLPGTFSATDVAAGGSIAGKVRIKPGFILTGATGYDYGPLRLEVEASYQENNLKNLTIDTVTVGGATFGGGFGTFDFNGTLGAFSLMANGFYDFKNKTKFTPFVMAGLGASLVNLDVESVGGASVNYDETDAVFAYQLGAGVSYQVAPRTSVNLSYRYFATEDPSFNDGVDKVDMEYHNHSVLIGLKSSF